MTSRGKVSRGKVSRTVVVVAGGLAAVALLVVSTRPWLVADVSRPLGANDHVAVRGSSAFAAVPALALVGLAAAGALTIARRLGQVVALAVLGVAGAAALAATLVVLSDPSRAARAAVAEATGRTVGSVTPGDATVVLTPWPFVSCVIAAALVGVAVLGYVARRAWPTSGRFETVTPAPGPRARASLTARDHERSSADDWDALSRGDDPTQAPE